MIAREGNIGTVPECLRAKIQGRRVLRTVWFLEQSRIRRSVVRMLWPRGTTVKLQPGFMDRQFAYLKGAVMNSITNNSAD